MKEKEKDREAGGGGVSRRRSTAWLTNIGSLQSQADEKERGGERERGVRKGGELDAGSQPHHRPTAFPLSLHLPTENLCLLS